MSIFTWKQRVLIVVVTVGTIAIFGLIGYLIGNVFSQWKLGVAIAIIVSYPFTQWALIRSVQRLNNKEKQEKK